CGKFRKHGLICLCAYPKMRCVSRLLSSIAQTDWTRCKENPQLRRAVTIGESSYFGFSQPAQWEHFPLQQLQPVSQPSFFTAPYTFFTK
ncbi:MAG: hypothetical protein IJ056_05450, partial [Acidaminococcaceae bacterium]|nr:hypothetical protein [Acidaminococcaceae bacterium]